MAPVVAREAGASPMTAREAVVAREDPVALMAALVVLMRPRGTSGVDGARLWWLRGRRRRQETAAKWGDDESGRRRRGGSRDLGGEGAPGRERFWGKWGEMVVAATDRRARGEE